MVTVIRSFVDLGQNKSQYLRAMMMQFGEDILDAEIVLRDELIELGDLGSTNVT
jgi:hypothetical protein